MGFVRESRAPVWRRLRHDRARRPHSPLIGTARRTRSRAAYCRHGSIGDGGGVTPLYELQKKFQDYVLSPQPGMEREIVSTPEADAKTRLEIYSDAYRLRLIEALATDYVAVKTLAGEEQFERLARAFIETHPSTYYNVRWFGESLAS